MQDNEQSVEVARAFAAGGEDTALRSALEIIKAKKAAAYDAWQKSTSPGASREWSIYHNWMKAANYLDAAMRDS